MNEAQGGVRDGARAWAGRHAGELGALVCALCWYLYLGYGATLDPGAVAWMFRGDWSTYHWSFAFFRHSDWALPLGAIPELFYPQGTTVGWMDGNPWLSVLFKPLSPLLPTWFQFHGAWLLLCFLLQALLGARIVAAFTPDAVQRALGGALFALTPILPARHVHVSLSALFFVTAGVALSLRPVADGWAARRRVGVSLLWLAWAAGTHGYLSAMLLALCLATYLQLWLVDRKLAGADAAIGAAAATTLCLGVYYLFGYLGGPARALTVEGFGQFSADLLTLVNPQGWSRWLPTLASGPRQHEGFGYLGAGGLWLVAAAIAVAATRPRLWLRWGRRHWPIGVMVVLLAAYALSSRVTLAGEEVLDLRALYAPFGAVTGVFRSSGRFIWPLHVMLLASAVMTVTQLRRRWLASALLAAAVLLQAGELRRERLDFSPVTLAPLPDPLWKTLGDDYDHLQQVPLHLLWVCRYHHRKVDRLMGIAYLEALSFNGGNYMGKGAARPLCNRHLPRKTPLDPRTVYVVDGDYRRDFRRPDAVCGRIDGLHVCAARERATALVHALRER